MKMAKSIDFAIFIASACWCVLGFLAVDRLMYVAVLFDQVV